MVPEHLNLGLYQTGTERDSAVLTADNHPLGNVYGFSENILNKMDIIEGETDLSVLKEKLWNGNNVILMAKYDDKGKLTGGADSSFYRGLSVGDTIQFYENGTPTEEFTIIAKVAATKGEITLTGGGSNISQIIDSPFIYMSEKKFKEIYETPTLYGFLFDVEEQYQQEMKYMERRGSGLRKIVSETEKLPGYTEAYKPEFTSTATDFRVILKNVNYNLEGDAHQVIHQVTHQVIELSTVSKQILAFCTTPKSKKELAVFCGFKDLRNFTLKHINPLLESGQLEMTIPDKPKSRNQKYITVRSE